MKYRVYTIHLQVRDIFIKTSTNRKEFADLMLETADEHGIDIEKVHQSKIYSE